jgi:glutamine synthetase
MMMPFFLIDFFDPKNPKTPLCACPRGLLKTVLEKLKNHSGIEALAGIEARVS